MIDFLKYKKYCLFLSIFFIAAGVFGYIKHGGFAVGIDFTGGTEVRIRFENVVDISALRKVFENSGFHDVSLQEIASGKEFLLKLADQDAKLDSRIENVVHQEIESKCEIVSIEQVGPEAGREVTENTIVSMFIMLLALLLYITLRQRYDYGTGAIVALAHDVSILLAFYLFFHVKFTLNIIIGILLVLGYSINDTIIIFSKIKQNAMLLRNMTNEEIVNISINQTLTRTILTSFATLVATFALYWFGGHALEDFSVCMLLGIIFGTYSSIFVAAPVMLAFRLKEL